MFTIIVILALLAEIWFMIVAFLFYSHTPPEFLKLNEFRGDITILKPLKGISPGLRENLISFLNLRSPGELQIIFAIADETDPVVRFLEKLLDEIETFNQVTILKGIPALGKNPKNSNLLAAFREARHPWIYISDADVWIEPDHLKKMLSMTMLFPNNHVTSVPLARNLQGFFSHLFGVGNNLDGAQYFAICAQLGKPLIFGGSNFFHRDLAKDTQALEKSVNLISEDLAMANLFLKGGGVGRLIPEPVVVSVGKMDWEEYKNLWIRWLSITRTMAGPVFWSAPLSWWWQGFLMAGLLFWRINFFKIALLLLVLRAIRLIGLAVFQRETLRHALVQVIHLPFYDLMVPYFWIRAAVNREVYFGGQWLSFNGRGEIL
jgi:ceramide glucosyltransferase